MAAARRSVEALERVAERADRDSRTQRIHSLLEVVLEMRKLPFTGQNLRPSNHLKASRGIVAEGGEGGKRPVLVP
jgi:hypothetical protein